MREGYGEREREIVRDSVEEKYPLPKKKKKKKKYGHTGKRKSELEKDIHRNLNKIDQNS